MARVLFTSCPAYGHGLPMLPLIRAAARAGHDVRVATGPDLVAPLASRGLDVHAVGPTWESSWSANEAVWADQSASEEQRLMNGVVALFGVPALARLDDLVDMTSQWRPDLVVHEVLEQAGSLLATRLGVRASCTASDRCSRSTPGSSPRRAPPSGSPSCGSGSRRNRPWTSARP